MREVEAIEGYRDRVDYHRRRVDSGDDLTKEELDEFRRDFKAAPKSVRQAFEERHGEAEHDPLSGLKMIFDWMVGKTGPRDWTAEFNAAVSGEEPGGEFGARSAFGKGRPPPGSDGSAWRATPQ